MKNNFGFFATSSVAAMLMAPVAALAELRTDGSLGPAQDLSGQMVVTPDLGQQRGPNVFHSFDRLSVNTGESLLFTTVGANGQVNHMIGRVTGGAASNIDGQLSVDGMAKLWLLNPAGLQLGSNAQVLAPGGLLLSTASSLNFQDGSVFFANLSDQSTLTISPPESVSSDGRGGNIVIDGARFELGAGSQSELIASNVSISNADIIGEDAKLQLHGFGRNPADALSLGDVDSNQTPSSGEIVIRNSQVLMSGPSGGRIQLQANNITVDQASLLRADVQSAAAQGQIQIRSNQLVVDGASIEVDDVRSRADADASKANDAATPAIDIIARNANVQNGTVISTSVFSSGATGRTLQLDVAGRLRVLDSADPNSVSTQIIADVSDAGTGGSVLLTVGELQFTGGFITADAGGARGADNNRAIGGLVQIVADNITMTGNATLSASARGDGSSRGLIDVQVANNFVMRGDGINTEPQVVARTVGSEQADSNFSGVLIEARRLDVENGRISVATLIEDEAPDALAERSRAGDLLINVTDLRLNQASIIARTEGLGLAGSIQIDATGRVHARDSRIQASADSSDGGDITFTAPVILLQDSDISARAQGSGGNVTIGDSNTRLILLTNTFVLADATEADGGQIQLRAANLVADQSNRFDASSSFGVDGDVQLQTAISELPNQQERQASGLPERPSQIQGGCARRAGSRVQSSLRVGGGCN